LHSVSFLFSFSAETDDAVTFLFSAKV